MKFFIVCIFAAILAISVCQVEDKKLEEGQLCKMCTRFITKLSKGILDHADDAKAYGHKVCDVLTFGKEDLDKQCRHLVDKKINYIVEQLRASKTAREICADIYFC